MIARTGKDDVLHARTTPNVMCSWAKILLPTPIHLSLPAQPSSSPVEKHVRVDSGLAFRSRGFHIAHLLVRHRIAG